MIQEAVSSLLVFVLVNVQTAHRVPYWLFPLTELILKSYYSVMDSLSGECRRARFGQAHALLAVSVCVCCVCVCVCVCGGGGDFVFWL